MATDENSILKQITGTSPPRVRRQRRKAESLKIKREEVADRIMRFFEGDIAERSIEIDARLQRYAKYRMWTEGKEWPWEECSDAAIPDLMQHSLRVQDTLHNAVMSIRPSISSKATQKQNRDKESVVDNLLDYQMFEEQRGEHEIGTLIENFVNDGVFTCYIPWVRERRETHDIRILGKIPYDALPVDHFRDQLEGMFPQATMTASADGWDWQIVDAEGDEIFASFYSRDDDTIEVDIEREATVFDGPRMIPKSAQDVLHPARCENLQIPGPSNPLGASHVLLRDYPTVDEIKRLIKSGFYDLVTKEEAAVFGLTEREWAYQELEEQKDTFQGVVEQHTEQPKGAESHKKLTRLMCFDCYDIDGDGIDEDVIWWMIYETKTILRARLLTQMFPSVPPRRPLAEAQFIPVPGRRLGIGLLEMMEGLHDLKKQVMDQTIDGGTLANVPFFFYKSTSNMRPETIRLWPGEGYPLTDPQGDVNFPQFPQQGQAFGMNMWTLITQEEERLTTTGDLQFGRVPQGKASALRTVSGMQTVLAQGDARPERILRRFFIGLTQVAKQFHELNTRYLPKRKEFRITGYLRPDQDPYKQIKDRKEIEGTFAFTFQANALNTNKSAMQQSLMQLLQVYVSELNVQLGILKPDGLYRLETDLGKVYGIDATRYLDAPEPGAFEPNILAEEAITLIMNSEAPRGLPAEGAEQHLQRLTGFVNSDEFGYLTPSQIELFREYLKSVQQRLMGERQKAALLSAVRQGPGQGGGAGGGVPTPGTQSAADIQQLPPVNDGELMDESLPGAGGGANPGPGAQ